MMIIVIVNFVLLYSQALVVLFVVGSIHVVVGVGVLLRRQLIHLRVNHTHVRVFQLL